MSRMNLYLIGYRGSGKSTVAPLVAEQLQWKWEDTDEQVELLAGCPISDIFAEYGERTFREWETTVIEALSRQSDYVISTGGGAPVDETNQRLMKSNGFCIWLSAPPSVLWKRISQDDKTGNQRPNLTDSGGLQEVETVVNARTPIYKACADYTIDVSSLSPEQIADAIVNWWDPVDN